jgi:hypothetical protein
MRKKSNKSYNKNKNKKNNKKNKSKNITLKQKNPNKWMTAPEAAQKALLKTGSISKARENFRRQIELNTYKVFGAL